MTAPKSGAEVVVPIPKPISVSMTAPKSGAEVVVPPSKSIKTSKKVSALDSISSPETEAAPKSKSQKTVQKVPSIFESTVKPQVSAPAPKTAAKSAKSTNAKKRAEALLSML
jgi:hypothetical protein